MSSFAIRSRGLRLPFSRRFDQEYVTISANIGFSSFSVRIIAFVWTSGQRLVLVVCWWFIFFFFQSIGRRSETWFFLLFCGMNLIVRERCNCDESSSFRWKITFCFLGRWYWLRLCLLCRFCIMLLWFSVVFPPFSWFLSCNRMVAALFDNGGWDGNC